MVWYGMEWRRETPTASRNPLAIICIAVVDMPDTRLMRFLSQQVSAVRAKNARTQNTNRLPGGARGRGHENKALRRTLPGRECQRNFGSFCGRGRGVCAHLTFSCSPPNIVPTTKF